jgi:transposase InsO family protein
VSARCALIEAEKANYKIAWMCALLGVARSSFYAWRNRVETPTAARRRDLAEKVKQVFDASRQTFGCRRVARELNDDGHDCSVGFVASLMRELGLKAVQPRAYKRTTIAGEQPVPAPDLIGRDFATGGNPGTRLVGDITYLKTGEGWLYLATVIDLATRMVIGWQIAEHMRTCLVTDALQMAIDAGTVEPKAIFHSDRGTQYTSAEFDAFCTTRHVRRSLGRTGVCWDNAVAEAFFAALKNDLYHRYTWPSRARARLAVAEYIEVFYNRRRRHSSLGYRTPAQAFTDHQRAATAA